MGVQDTRRDALLFGNRRPMFNVGVSNVPGPQTPLYMNGARAERIFGVVPIFDGTALVFGVFSYRGAIEVTFLAECLQSAYHEMLARLAPIPATVGSVHE